MKADYKKGWSGSSQKRKQRKFRAAAETLGIVPAHIAFGFPLNAVAVKRW